MGTERRSYESEDVSSRLAAPADLSRASNALMRGEDSELVRAFFPNLSDVGADRAPVVPDG